MTLSVMIFNKLRAVLVISAAAIFVSGVAINPAHGQYLPSVKIGTAALISPTAADSYYGTATTHTNGVGYSASPPEIVELALALKSSPDLIYEYVRNNINTNWEYGLQKGALGALIDKSGTAFDQAALMVALLRQAGYTASYQVGTITLTGAQFAAWSNVSDAAAACQMLSGGAIPAVINSSTLSDCSYGSGTPISTVTLSHIWVIVSIAGSSCASACLFDPSYKPYSWQPGVNLAAAIGMTSGDPLSTATSTTDSGSSFGLPYVHNFNASGLGTLIQGYGSNLLSYLQTNHLQGAEVDDLIGSGAIAQYVSPSGGLRQTTLPYDSSVLRSWSGDIPNQYRTTLNVNATQARLGGVVETLFNQLLYVDEIYGRRLSIGTNFNNNQIGTAPDYGHATAFLDLDDQPLLTYTLAGINLPDQRNPATITLTADHPYASSADPTSPAASGDYMDATVVKNVILITPLSIVHGWGDTGPGLLSKWANERKQDLADPNRINPPPCPSECDYDLLYLASTGDFQREKAQANYLAQFSRAAHLHAGIAKGIAQIHHVLGVIYADDYVDDDGAQKPPGMPLDYFVTDSYSRIDIDSGLSFASRTGIVADRRAAIQSIAATGAMLEASVMSQTADLPDSSSTATRFEWGNNPTCLSSTDPRNCEDPSLGGPRRFFQFGTSSSVPSGWMLWENAATPPASVPYDPQGDPQSWAFSEMTALTQEINAYTAGGFQITASQESFLGPGQRGGYVKASPLISGGYSYDPAWTKQRGGAFVATKYNDGGDPLEIAHDVVGLIVAPSSSPVIASKGGGGGLQPMSAATYSPSDAGNVLKSRFVDKSNLLGINLENGTLAFSSPGSMTVGSGDSPYALSASASWHQTPSPDKTFAPIPPGQLTGWVNNWTNGLSISGGGMEGMGSSDLRAAAGTIAAFMAEQDIYKNSPSSARDVSAELTQSWLSHQYQGNVTTVVFGGSSRQFTRLVDGSWIAPGSSYAQLAQSGTRAPFNYQCPSYTPGPVPTNYAQSRGWDNSGLTFTVKGPHGDAQNYVYWLQHYQTTEHMPACGRSSGFELSTWTLSQGITVTLSYEAGTTSDGTAASSSPNAATSYPSGTHIQQVSNNLGRSLTFNYTAALGDSYAYLNNIGDGNGRSLYLPGQNTTDPTYGRDATIDPTTALTSFLYNAPIAGTSTQRPIPYSTLFKVYTAENAGAPNSQYDYNSVGQISAVHDAVNLQIGGRNPWYFLIGDGTRGERDDPLGNAYSVTYGIQHNPTRYIDELGRLTRSLHDSRDRVMQYLYPEGDCELMGYDDHNNQTSLIRVSKTDSCNPSATANLTVTATYDTSWNKPLSIINARGFQTDFSYFASGTGASLLQTATRPAPSGTGARPTYNFTYNALGQLATSTDPTGIVTANNYDSVGSGHFSNLLSSVVDSGSGHLNLTTAFGYDGIGNVTAVTDPRGNVLESAFDLDRRKTDDLHHDGAIGATLLAATNTTYDILGRAIQQKAGKTFTGTTVATWYNPTTTTYTVMDKVSTVTDPDGKVTTTTYDALDRVDVVTDPVGRKAHTAYDAASQVAADYRGWTSAIQITYAAYTYTPNGQRASVTDANGNLSAYTYDGFDRLSQLAFPSPTVPGSSNPADYEAYSYDQNSNLTQKRTRKGDFILASYDHLDRLGGKEDRVGAAGGPLQKSYAYLYDLAGRLSDLSDSAGNDVANGYDTAGRQTSAATTIAGLSGAKTIGYTLDANGNRTQLSWPGSYTVTYGYDALNRMVTATDSGAVVLGIYSYDPLSRRTGLAYGNGATAAYSYSDAGDLLSLSHDLAGTSADVAFTYTYTDAHQLASLAASNSGYLWHPAGPRPATAGTA